MDLEFIDRNNIQIVDNGGTILRSSDGGSVWSQQFVDPNQPIYFANISFYDNKTGIVAGIYDYSSLVYKTTDGGTSWNQLPAIKKGFMPTTVHFKDSVNIAVIGRQSPFSPEGTSPSLYSTDGGKTWAWGSDSIYEYLNNVSPAVFQDKNVGVFTTYYSHTSQVSNTIYKTTDGGISWKSIHSMGGYQIYLNRIGIVSPENYLLVGAKGIIYKLDSSGKTITPQISGTQDLLRDVYFSDPLNGTIVGENGTILRSCSWEVKKSGTNRKLKSVSFADSNIAFVLQDIANIMKTTDKGITWSKTYTLPEEFSEIEFANENFGIIVGPDNKILYTKNGGVDWLEIPINGSFQSVSMLDSLNAIIVGKNGIIYHTSNGGKVWAKQNSGTNSNLHSVHLVNTNIAFAVGDGIVLSTTNGGREWRKQNVNSDASSSIYFSDPKHGTIVGKNGYILLTSDGGDNWIVQVMGGNNKPSLNSVIFTDILNGIAVGDSGTILVTNNGGKNWKKEYVNTSANLYDIAIKDSIVICVGEGGIAVRRGNWITDYITSVELPSLTSEIADDYILRQNYPNPFNPSTTIEYYIPETANVTIKVFDMLGREVETLVDEEKQPGIYKAMFYGTNLSSGVYFYRLDAGSFTEIKKLIFIK